MGWRVGHRLHAEIVPGDDAAEAELAVETKGAAIDVAAAVRCQDEPRSRGRTDTPAGRWRWWPPSATIWPMRELEWPVAVNKLSILVAIPILLLAGCAGGNRKHGTTAVSVATPIATKNSGGNAGGPANDDPVDRSIPVKSPEFDAIAVAPGSIPAGLTISPGDPACDSIQPLTFYSQPTMFGAMPRPEARRADRFMRGDRLVGTVAMYHYRPEQVAHVRSFLTGHLWGDAQMPTVEHPEEMVVVGSTVLILCFDANDPAGDWYRNQLRFHPGVRVARRCPALYAYDRAAEEAGQQSASALAPVLSRHEAALLACSSGAVRVGEVALTLKDGRRAEAAFRRALELDTVGDALTGRGLLFYANYGLGLALEMQGRTDESVDQFKRALVIAKQEGDRSHLGWGTYNLACAQAEAGRFAEAAKALEEAISLDPTHKVRASKDRSFEKARELATFKRLLK